MLYRPDSTINDTAAGVFWEVEDLRELPKEEQISIAKLTGLTKAKPYGKSFPPHKPILIRHP
jgi:hypothetical protein